MAVKIKTDSNVLINNLFIIYRMNILLIFVILLSLLGGVHLALMGFKNLDFSLLQYIFKEPFSKYIYITIGFSIVFLAFYLLFV